MEVEDTTHKQPHKLISRNFFELCLYQCMWSPNPHLLRSCGTCFKLSSINIVPPSYIVPAAAPLFNITSTTNSSIAIAWQPLPSCQENGVITNYTIAYRAEADMGLDITELVVPATSRTAVISQLTPYMNYVIKMAASTSVGRGGFGPEVTVQTNEDGKTEKLLDVKSHHCLLCML